MAHRIPPPLLVPAAGALLLGSVVTSMVIGCEPDPAAETAAPATAQTDTAVPPPDTTPSEPPSGGPLPADAPAPVSTHTHGSPAPANPQALRTEPVQGLADLDTITIVDMDVPMGRPTVADAASPPPVAPAVTPVLPPPPPPPPPLVVAPSRRAEALAALSGFSARAPQYGKLLVLARLSADGQPQLFDVSPLTLRTSQEVMHTSGVTIKKAEAPAAGTCRPLVGTLRESIADELTAHYHDLWRHTRGWKAAPTIEAIEVCVSPTVRARWERAVARQARQQGIHAAGRWVVSMDRTGTIDLIPPTKVFPLPVEEL